MRLLTMDGFLRGIAVNCYCAQDSRKGQTDYYVLKNVQISLPLLEPSFSSCNGTKRELTTMNGRVITLECCWITCLVLQFTHPAKLNGP